MKNLLLSIGFVMLVLVACTPTSEPVLQATVTKPVVAEETAVSNLVQTVSIAQNFIVGVGETAAFSHSESAFTLTFNGVIEDSRCPSQVNCAEAGLARLSVTASQNGDEPQTFDINTNPMVDQHMIRYNGYDIFLVDLKPYPETLETPIPATDYQAEFTISPSVATPTPANSGGIEMNQPFTLAIGETAVLPNTGLSVRFDAILEDSRCPKSVTCVWAGQVIAVLTVQEAEQNTAELQISPDSPTTAKQASYGAYTVEITAVTPYPLTSDPIPADQYQATVIITQ